LAFEKKAKKNIAEYLENNTSRKLHLGCGHNILTGWLNTDILTGEKTTYLDATIKFPIPDNSFSFIFSEHMIEHIPLKQGRIMLTECFRILNKGGIIRIATPDLAKILPFYQPVQDEQKKRYLKWAEENFIKEPTLDIHNLYINNYFRNWGHQFIYDFTTLKQVLEQIGYVNIIEVPVYKSNHAELNNIELHHKTISVEYNLLESFAIEASKA
jgi:predicted SAM-dependent methyltransferase